MANNTIPAPPVPQIVRLGAACADALAELFARIATDPDARFFHPHPFDAANAHRICSMTTSDLYFGLLLDGRMQAYAMLRGWDEGFAVPSLGIYLAPPLRGTGAARMLMGFLEFASRNAGAPSIRLKVYPENHRAQALYRRLGYVFADPPGADGQLLGVLTLGRQAG